MTNGFREQKFEKEALKVNDQEHETCSSESDDILLLDLLADATREKVQKNMAAREELIKKLTEQPGSTPEDWFKKIFGVPSPGVRAVIKQYGIYFYNVDYKAIKEIIPSYVFAFHRGVAINDPKFLEDKNFLNMVGFGRTDSTDHEFSHMFNSMLPFQETALEYEKMQEDVKSPRDPETIAKVKSEHYRLWANSILKDEILSRISNDQILKAEEQDFEDNYSSETKVFTTYEPRTLYGYISPYKSDAESFGVNTVSREEADRFWDLYYKAVDPIRKHWLDVYNKTLDAIQRAMRFGVSKLKIKAVIIEGDFENISTLIENLIHESSLQVTS